MGRRKTTPRRSLGRRLFRAACLVLLASILLSLVPVLALRWVDPPTTSFMLRHPGAVEQQWVEAARLSPWLALAVVAAEDQLFPLHHGFDTGSLRQAWQEHRSGRRTRGASTISQQVAKNLFLWPGQSLARKGLEAWFTLWIELLWPKQRILEVYLNVAEFGAGVYGAEAAARRYFGKPAAALSIEEAALLAAVLPSPKRFRADAPTPYLRQRVAWIRGQIAQLGGPAYLADCCAELVEAPR
jgi:monofunctional glycosyltransferase